MWGRELRAGLIFVLVSTALGGAFRGWERAHHPRFEELVRSLVEADAASSSSSGGLSADTSGLSSGDARVGTGTSRPGDHAHPRNAQPPGPASMDIDRADTEELMRLPGIGPALAARIVAERRANGPFGGPDGLLRVRGIGVKTLARIRPYMAGYADTSAVTR